MRDDYISRQAAIAVIYGQHIGGKEACENARPNTYGADLREIVADIEDIPPADVRPVVLCDDCRYANRTDLFELWCNGFCHPARLVRPDDFCSHGEARY